MSRIRGVRAFRQRLKQLPDAVTTEILDLLDEGGRTAAAAMQARARRRTGQLAAGVTYKVLPKSLRLRVGLLGTPRGRAKLFYGYILDRGRKAQTVTVTRYRKGARAKDTRRFALGSNGQKSPGLVSVYQLRVRARAGDAFVTGRFRELRGLINRRANDLFDRALRRIGAGG